MDRLNATMPEQPWYFIRPWSLLRDYNVKDGLALASFVQWWRDWAVTIGYRVQDGILSGAINGPLFYELPDLDQLGRKLDFPGFDNLQTRFASSRRAAGLKVPDTIRGKHHLFGKHSGELAIMSLPQTPSRLSSATRRSPRGTSTPSTLSAKNSARVYCARKSTRQPLAPRLPPKRHTRWAT